MSEGSSVQRFHKRGMTNDIVDTPTEQRSTSTTLFSLEWLTCCMRHIVKFSLAALNTAPIKPPKQPIIMNKNNSQIEKLDASPVKLLNSPNENNFSTSA
mmetsp:Transcript_63416/g.75047  ORF Transcript_63416/g.75047 Transcript_63416/m.75047 type:complete len:99 (+) Transcript_63416:1342-1638(+)